MNIEELSKPLKADAIKTRSQSGVTLSYLEAHHVIREANRIFGFDGWKRHTAEFHLVQAEEKLNQKTQKMQWYVGYVAKATIEVDGITRDGFGFGQGVDADLGRAHESAIKEAESDAMKRALMTFGDQFGLALYDKQQTHVEKSESVKQYEAPPAEPKPNPHAKTAGDFIKKIGLDAKAFKAYKDRCALCQLDWVTIANLAFTEKVTNEDELTLFVESKRQEKEAA